jgi:AraC-like DNA-binding protein
MRSAGPVRGFATLWDIATPPHGGRLPGVSMAGFRSRTSDLVDIPIVPFPAVTIFVDFGDAIVVDDSSGRQQGGGGVVGLTSGSVRAHGRHIDCLQVRLSPAVAHTVLGVPGLLGEMVVALDDLWGRDSSRIQEQLRDAASWDDRFAIAETALARRFETGRTVDQEVSFAWDRMVTRRGRVRVDQLAARIGWSRKQLWSRFRAQVGLTPKRAAELVRFDHAAHRLAAGSDIAQVALDSGYVDQSHLHRDALAFTGLTPTAVAVAPWLAVDDIAWPAQGRRPQR